MRESYPTIFCPPKAFAPDNKAIKIRAGLIELLNAPIDSDWSGQTLQDAFKMVMRVLGFPKDRDKFGDWLIDYVYTWQKLIAREMERGFIHGQQYVNTIYKPITEELLGLFSRYMEQKEVNSLRNDLVNPWLYIFAHWHAMGRKEYIVSKGLAQKLKQTRLKGYPSSNLHLPFDSIYIDLHHYGDFGETTTEGCLALQTENRIVISLVLRDSNKTDIPRLLNIQKDHNSLETGLEKALEEYKNLEGMHDLKANMQRWRELFSYIVNVILYATMQDAEQVFQRYDPTYEKLQRRLKKQKSPKKREKIKQQLKKVPSAGYTLLGGSIKVDRTEERTETYEKGQRKITVRTLVSGHWRDQPCGKGNLDRKRIWIEPFWRGPEGAPITQRSHHLQ